MKLLKMKFEWKGMLYAFLACLFAVSCTDELPDYPVPLDSPGADLITIDASNPSKLVFSWPAVEEAAGYEFSLYKVDDKGLNPVVVGTEKEAVAGTSVERPQEASTYYKIVLASLGDKKNRSNAQMVTEKLWNNIPIILKTPAANQVVIDAEDAGKLRISWPAVDGASGFEFSLYKVNAQGENPVAVGTEKEVVAGTSVERPQDPFSYYKIALKVLGDPSKNTVDGDLMERFWDNLPANVIPSGTNLTEYVRTNPISGTEEVTLLLAPYGVYSMNGNIALGTTPVVVRAQSKDAQATINVTDGSFVNSGAGFRLENLILDYSGFLAEKDGENNLTNNAVVLMNSALPEGAALSYIGENGYLLITDPIVLQSCKITGLKGYLFYDNNQRYAVETLRIEDCIVGMNTGTWNQATFRFQLALLKDFTITKSTVYNEVELGNSSQRFMQFNHNVYASQLTEWSGGTMTITNCTFWQAGKGAQAFNSNNAMGRPDDLVTIQKNVFVDSYEDGRIVSRFRRGNTNAQFAGGGNTQWYNGANFTGSQDLTADTDRIETDPGLTYVGNGVFTMSGSAQREAGTGDPRWLQ